MGRSFSASEWAEGILDHMRSFDFSLVASGESEMLPATLSDYAGESLMRQVVEARELAGEVTLSVKVWSKGHKEKIAKRTYPSHIYYCLTSEALCKELDSLDAELKAQKGA